MASDAWAICREIRARSGLTQRTLASRAGVSPATVAKIEKGRMQPTLELLEKLASAAGLELRVALDVPDPDTRRARLLARQLTGEERLIQNDAVSRFSTSGGRR